MRRSTKPDAGRAAEADVRRQELAVAHGATSIGLNLFSHNAVVRGLYQSLGSEEISMQMRKSLQHKKTPSRMSARTCKGTMTSRTEGHRRAERQVPVRAASCRVVGDRVAYGFALDMDIAMSTVRHWRPRSRCLGPWSFSSRPQRQIPLEGNSLPARPVGSNAHPGMSVSSFNSTPQQAPPDEGGGVRMDAKAVRS
jgi:hypothetical protein